jgi:hypothetical protein
MLDIKLLLMVSTYSLLAELSMLGGERTTLLVHFRLAEIPGGAVRLDHEALLPRGLCPRRRCSRYHCRVTCQTLIKLALFVLCIRNHTRFRFAGTDTSAPCLVQLAMAAFIQALSF